MLTLSATARNYPRLPYERMASDILGEKYMCSLVFVGKTRARALNILHRKKTYVPNVLSFPLEPTVGEIYITPEVAAREAKHFHMTPKGYIGYLFIHALLHLKGIDHGEKMDSLEARYVKKYRLK